MNAFGRPHWQTSQHFPISLTFIAGTNYRSSWHSLHMGDSNGNDIFRCYLSQYVLYLCHRKPKGNEHKLLLVSVRSRGRHVVVMNVSSTDRDWEETDVFMHQIINDCCSTPENESKMRYWTHSTKLNQEPLQYPSELLTPFPDWIAVHATFHFMRLMCADRKLARLNWKQSVKWRKMAIIFLIVPP